MVAEKIEKKRMWTDNTFSMLYDMIPRKVEEYIFLPLIESLLSPKENEVADIENKFAVLGLPIESDILKYWYFLEKMYSRIHYVTSASDIGNAKKSIPYIYRFIAEKEDFYHDYADIKKLLAMEQHSEIKKELGSYHIFKLDEVLSDPKLQPILNFLLSHDSTFWKEYQWVKQYYERLKNSIRPDAEDLYDMF